MASCVSKKQANITEFPTRGWETWGEDEEASYLTVTEQ